MECKGSLKKKSPDDVKDELLGLLINTEKKDEPRLNNTARSAKEPKETIAIIKEYKEILKGQNEEIITIVGKQGQLLKWFKESDGFFAGVGLSQSNIPVLKNSMFL